MSDQANGCGKPLIWCAVRVGRRLSLAERNDLDGHARPAGGGSGIAGGSVFLETHQSHSTTSREGRSFARGHAAFAPCSICLARELPPHRRTSTSPPRTSGRHSHGLLREEYVVDVSCLGMRRSFDWDPERTGF
jgi:hypothetical protein